MSLALIYIARGFDAGIDAARTFIEAYTRYDPGVAHQLYVATKGWESGSALAEVKKICEGVGAKLIAVPDDGFDWGAYIRLSKELQEDRVCFLNSHSAPLVPNWLFILNRGLDEDGVGAVGATASLSTWGFSKPYWRPSLKYTFQYPLRFAQELYRHWKYSKHYPPFPNPHLRTNAVLISRRLYCEFCSHVSVPADKSESHILESGRHGLSMFILSKHLEIRVCGANGDSYSVPDWVKSKTFRLGEQENLLVEDNQTRIYQLASPDMRLRLQFKSWQGTVAHESTEPTIFS